jgi:hypothetical protein
MKVREIAGIIGISEERVGYILHEELYMKRLCARWVPRLLTADQKHTHDNLWTMLGAFLTKIKLILCFCRFITMDET